MLPDSDFVISMPQAEYASTQATLQQYATTPEHVPSNMFENAEGIVLENLLDMYVKFFHSADFQQFLHAREQQLLGVE